MNDDIDTLAVVPPEKPLKMRTQPIVPPSAKRLWQKLWLKSHEGKSERRSALSTGVKAWYGDDYAKLVRGRRRRLAGLVLVTVLLGLAKWMAAMPSDIAVWTRAAVIVLFILTFGWIALYFWSSIFGFLQLLKRAKMPGLKYPGDVEAALDAALDAAFVAADGGVALVVGSVGFGGDGQGGCTGLSAGGRDGQPVDGTGIGFTHAGSPGFRGGEGQGRRTAFGGEYGLGFASGGK